MTMEAMKLLYIIKILCYGKNYSMYLHVSKECQILRTKLIQ